MTMLPSHHQNPSLHQRGSSHPDLPKNEESSFSSLGSSESSESSDCGPNNKHKLTGKRSAHVWQLLIVSLVVIVNLKLWETSLKPPLSFENSFETVATDNTGLSSAVHEGLRHIPLTPPREEDAARTTEGQTKEYRDLFIEIQDSSENVLPPGCDYAKSQIDKGKTYDTCVVGAGLSGTVLAERSANVLNEKVLIFDSRPHIGGNCYDFIDPKTGVLQNQYGSHLFHTKIKRVWEYVTQTEEFAGYSMSPPKWSPWYHYKFGWINGSLYDGMLNDTFYVPIPPNMMTVNRLFGTNLRTAEDMQAWLKEVQIPCPESGCRNAEEMAMSRVGKALYEAIFETYTIKQWNKSPKDMDASVTARIPVRTDFDPRYFADKWQALPSDGYTAWFEAMLNHENIDVVLNTNFFDEKQHLESSCDRIVYTGPIDRFFQSQGLPSLEYRGIKFTEERHYHTPGYILPTPVVNFPGPEREYTRAIEYKHYLHRSSPHSLVVWEQSTDDGEPYYPVPNPRNLELYAKYQRMAEDLERQGQFLFVGRLANYKYFDMDKAIDNALQLFDQGAWTRMFRGRHFDDYRVAIDRKIEQMRRSRLDAYRSKSESDQTVCEGHHSMQRSTTIEWRVIVPWAYSQHEKCDLVYTSGLAGTKYMYYFSDRHSIFQLRGMREELQSPNANLLPSIPEGAEWKMPSFRQVFAHPKVRSLLPKPLVIIQNDHANVDSAFSRDLLDSLMTYLSSNYTIIYRNGAVAPDDLDPTETREWIREKHPHVVLFDDLLTRMADPEDRTLLLFSVLSSTDHFLSVMGSSAAIAAYFGCNSTLLLQKSSLEETSIEMKDFVQFSNATIAWKHTNKDFLAHIQSIL